MRGKRIILGTLCGAAAALAGCGGDGDGSDTTRVVSVNIGDNDILVGEGSVIQVRFTFDSDKVADGDNAYIVVELPGQVNYRAGTAEIDGQTTEDDDSISPIITDCGAGSSEYLMFQLDRDDLDHANNPSGDADAQITLTVDAVAAGNATIRALGREIQPAFGCTVAFAPDSEATLFIQ